jgi:RNA polymerase sigma-70 factor (ECF subfamily)
MTNPTPHLRLAADGLVAGRTACLVPAAAVRASARIDRAVLAAVTGAKAGDPEAVRFLYTHYAGNVYGYVRPIVHGHHDAEDVTQQVFTKLITAVAHYEPRTAPFIGWLLRLARNAAIDHLRRQRATPAEEVYGPGARVDDEMHERSRDLRSALDTLPHDQRAVMMLRHIHGLTPAEIAGSLGRTRSSVHGLHHRGRRALCLELTRLGSAPTTLGRPRAAA